MELLDLFRDNYQGGGLLDLDASVPRPAAWQDCQLSGAPIRTLLRNSSFAYCKEGMDDSSVRGLTKSAAGINTTVREMF
jgi:hypothetical protein